MAIHAAPMTLFVIILFAAVLIFGGYQLYQQLNNSSFYNGGVQEGGVASVVKCTYGTVTATKGIKSGNNVVFSDLGSNNAWARILIKNNKGQTLDSHIVNQGSSYYSTATGLTITVANVRALLDGTIIGVDVYIGSSCSIPTTTTTTTTTTTSPPPSQCVIGTVTATSSVSYGNYKIYSDLGSNGAWARILVKTVNATLESKVINVGSSWDFQAESMTIKVLNVSALQDGTVLGTYIKVGPLGTTC